jgi:predicted small secreted protein
VRRSGAVVAWVLLAALFLAASPSPTSGVGGDPRSSGQGPGLVGDPLFAVVAVFVIGIGAVLLTLAYVRLTARHGS